MEKIFCYSEEELAQNINEIINLLVSYRVWLFYGKMGSGKTTLARNIAKALGQEEEVSSPTFTLINEYHFKSNPWHIDKMYHLDLYRLDNLQQALDAGIEDLLDTQEICIIEWPEMIVPLLSDLSRVEIQINTMEGGKREYKIKS